MGCPSEVIIGGNLVFSVCTHDPDTGELTDADAVPSYRVYEAETATPILTGNMAKLDDGNTTGFYTESIACTAANGFEDGKSYTVYIQATVDSAVGAISYGFRAWSGAVTVGGGGSSLGPLAEDDVEYAEATVFAGGTLALGALVRDWGGTDMTQSDVARLEYSIVERVTDTDGITETDTAVPNHTDVPLVIAETVYDTAQSDGDWSNYNLKFVPEVYTSYPPFPTSTVNAQGVDISTYVVTVSVWFKNDPTRPRLVKWKVKAI